MKRKTILLAVLCLAIVSATSAHAQVTTATLYGRVVDPSGAAVPGASITATNELTSTTKSTESNERGEFALPFLTVGRYTVNVALSGFKTHKVTGMEMSSGQKLDLTFTLELGAPSETITVTSQAPLLNTVNAEQDISIGNVQVAELPLAKRDFTSLLNLGTGMSNQGDSVSMNGLPPRGFTFSVDGVNAAPDSEFSSKAMYQNFNYIKGVSMEAVKEVEVSKNVFSAEIGKSVSGNVNIITKGGTNQFHGSAFEQYQSGGLNAVNHFTSIKSPLMLHQFGGSFGGPIIKDKVFFFGAYEGYRYHGKSAISGLVPTVGIRQQVTAVLPAAKGYFDLWPLPTAAEKPGDVTAQFAGIATETRDDNHAVIRGDFNLSSGSFLSIRYTRSRPNYLQPRLAIGNPRIRAGMSENGSATYTRVWSPKMTSEIRFGYNLADLSRMDNQYGLAVGSISAGGLPAPERSYS